MGFDLGPAPEEKQDTSQGGFDLGPAPGSNTPAPAAQPTEEPKPLDTLPDESVLSGTAKNAATSTIKGVAHNPGMIGDLRELSGHIIDMALARARGVPIEQVQGEGTKGFSSDAYKQAAKVLPIMNLIAKAPTGADIAAPILKKTGEYEPTTELGKYGSLATEGATSMLGPGSLTGNPLKTALSVLGGATSGPAGKAAHDLGAPPEAELAASMLAPVLTGRVAGTIGKAAEPLTASGRQNIADQRFLEHTADPAKARAKLEAEPPGSLNTTAEVTGDVGHAQAEDKFQIDPKFRGKVQEAVTIPRNEQRQGQLASTAPIDADPTDVSAGFQKHLGDLNAQAEAAAPAAAPTPDVTGGTLREAGTARRDVASESLDRLKKSIDPEGKMGTWTGDLNDFATSKLKEGEARPLKGAMSDVAQEYFNTAANLKDVTKFNDLVDFDQSITQGLKKTKDVDPAGYSALLELKGQVKTAINSSLENQHKWEQVKHQDGTLNPEDTIASRLQRERDEWLARKKATDSAQRATGTEPADTAATGDVSPTAGTGSQGSGAAGSTESVPGSTPLEPMSGDAADRLKLFNKGYGTYKDTFDKGVVGKALDTEFGGQPKQMNADVAQKAFVPGPKGYETAQMWLHAGGEEGAAALKDIATSRLQSSLKNEPLDKAALDKWKTQHADALRALDESEQAAGRPKFSEQFNDAATAQQTVQNFEKSAAAKFMKLEHPDDVVNNVGRMMKTDNSAQRITDLMQQAKDAGVHGDAVTAGLRRAGAQWLKNEFSNNAELPGQGGKSIPILGPKLKDFIAERRNTLEAMFDPAAMKTMDQLAESFQRSKTVETLRSQLGSPTAGRLPYLQKQIQLAMAHDAAHGNFTVGDAANFALMGELIRDPSIRAGVLLTGKKVFDSLHNAIGGARARGMTNINDLVADGFVNPEIGKAMLGRAMDAQGNANPVAFEALTKAILGAQNVQQQEQRQGHASGGAVFDHKAAAKHMIGLVDKVRKRDADRTKPLLQAHDTTIANALALANRSI